MKYAEAVFYFISAILVTAVFAAVGGLVFILSILVKWIILGGVIITALALAIRDYFVNK